MTGCREILGFDVVSGRQHPSQRLLCQKKRRELAGGKPSPSQYSTREKYI